MGLRDRIRRALRRHRIRRFGLTSAEQQRFEEQYLIDLRRAAGDHYPETDTPEEDR